MERSREKNPDDAQVSREELAALGISDNVSMTRGELNKRLETEKLRSGAEQQEREKAIRSVEEDIAQLSDEEQNTTWEKLKKRG